MPRCLQRRTNYRYKSKFKESLGYAIDELKTYQIRRLEVFRKWFETMIEYFEEIKFPINWLGL